MIIALADGFSDVDFEMVAVASDYSVGVLWFTCDDGAKVPF